MKKKKLNAVSVLSYILLTIAVILCLYPFYYVLIYSISEPDQASQIILLPKGFSLDTYKSVFNLGNIKNAFIVSVARTVLGAALTIIATSFLAYLVTQQKMYARRVVYRLIIVSMYLNAGLIPWYLTMKVYGLQDNFLLYILPTAVQAYYLILIKTFIESLPKSLEEAAVMDGCGFVKCYFRIILPLSKPIIATIAVYATVAQWNTWIDNYFLVNAENLQTLQLILYNYVNQTQNVVSSTVESLNSESATQITSMSLKMCITVVVTLPIICVYPFLQRYFVKGLLIGAVKG